LARAVEQDLKGIVAGAVEHGRPSALLARMSITANLLDNESIEVGQLLDGGLGGVLKVFLFVLPSDRVLVTEDEVELESDGQHLLLSQ
jgi:hypothetical protein